jgi:hypothetical protein
MTPLFLIALLAQDPFTAAPRNYKLEFENAWVRVIRVTYGPHEKTPVHDHPATPLVYVYLSERGRMRVQQGEADPVTRDGVKAGTIRFSPGAKEHHSVEELDGVASELLRIELKTKPVDLPDRDVILESANRQPYENGMLRILRLTCPARTTCPMSEHPENPAIVIVDRNFLWQDPGLQMNLHGKPEPLEQIRIELKSRP